MQVQLYEDFAKSRAKQSVEDAIEGEPSNTHGTSHIFQVIIHLSVILFNSNFYNRRDFFFMLLTIMLNLFKLYDFTLYYI